MGKTISNKLAIIVTASTAALQRGMLKAGNMVRGFAKTVNGAGSFIQNNIIGIGLAAAAGGYGVAQLSAIAEKIDEVAKSADRLGMTTQAFIGLKHAAELGGAGEEFESAIQGMMKNVGLAERGLGRARSAFAYLGISAKKLGALSPENQFKVLAEYIRNVEDPTQRLTLATQIFGDAGAKMIAVLNEGAAGLEKIQAQTEATGQAFSRFDAAKVEIMNDAITDLKAELGVIGQKLVIEIAPYVTGLVNAFRAWSASGKSWGEIVGQAVELVGRGIGHLLDLIDYGKIVWEGVKIAGNAVLWALFKSVEMVGRAITKVMDFALEKAAKVIDLAAEFLPEEVTKRAKAQIDAIKGAASEANNTLAALNKEFENNMAASAKTIEDIWTGQSRADKFSAWMREGRIAMDAAAKAIADAAPKPETFNMGMVDAVKETAKEAQKVLAIKEKIADVDFQSNSIIRAGSADAQVLPFVAAQKSREQQLQKQIDLQKQQLATLKRIDNNTQEEEAVVL